MGAPGSTVDGRPGVPARVRGASLSRTLVGLRGTGGLGARGTRGAGSGGGVVPSGRELLLRRRAPRHPGRTVACRERVPEGAAARSNVPAGVAYAHVAAGAP